MLDSDVVKREVLMWLLVDMTVQEGKNVLEVVDEIPYSEVRYMQGLFHFLGAFNITKMACEIVRENGVAYRRYMHEENLNALIGDHSIIIREANRLIYNYASSIKTFIDISERFLTKDFGPHARKSYHDDVQSKTYDNSFEYAFFAKLRNYVVHRMFPYTSINVSGTGVRLHLDVEELLRWDKWHDLKGKIRERGPRITPEDYVFRATASVYAIWIGFITYYGENIVSAWNAYGAFTEKWGMRGSVGFAEVENREDILHGMNVNPLPLGELKECFELLRKHPSVEIAYPKASDGGNQEN